MEVGDYVRIAKSPSTVRAGIANKWGEILDEFRDFGVFGNTVDKFELELDDGRICRLPKMFVRPH